MNGDIELKRSENRGLMLILDGEWLRAGRTLLVEGDGCKSITLTICGDDISHVAHHLDRAQVEALRNALTSWLDTGTLGTATDTETTGRGT